MSPASSFFLATCTEHDVYGMDYPFGQLESAVLALSFVKFPCIPSSLASMAACKAEKAVSALLSSD